MKIALFGSTGRIGKCVLNEALTRAHRVTAIVRDVAHANSHTANLEFKTGDVLKPDSPLNWTFVSPPVDIFEGTRTGSYRIGKDQMIIDRDSKCRISVEDYAKAVIDAVERPQFLRQRFTVGY